MDTGGRQEAHLCISLYEVKVQLHLSATKVILTHNIVKNCIIKKLLLSLLVFSINLFKEFTFLC